MNESQGAVGDSPASKLETIQCELGSELEIAAARVFLRKRHEVTGWTPLAVQLSDSEAGWRQAAIDWIRENREREGKRRNVA